MSCCNSRAPTTTRPGSGRLRPMNRPKNPDPGPRARVLDTHSSISYSSSRRKRAFEILIPRRSADRCTPPTQPRRCASISPRRACAAAPSCAPPLTLRLRRDRCRGEGTPRPVERNHLMNEIGTLTRGFAREIAAEAPADQPHGARRLGRDRLETRYDSRKQSHTESDSRCNCLSANGGHTPCATC